MAKSTPREDNTLLYGALLMSALLLVGALLAYRFLVRVPPPLPPPTSVQAPAPAAESWAAQQQQRPLDFQATLVEDARRYGVTPPTLDALAAPLDHAVELDTPKVLHAGDTLETPLLKLTTQVIKATAEDSSGQGFRYEHFILTIANKGTRPIAYRIDTDLDGAEKCRSQGAIAHNAVALLPGEKIRRAECLYHSGMALTVRRIETVALSDLGYYYVSRLVPSQIGLDPRTSAGHTNPAGTDSCKFVPWREIETGGASWADVIDFYARHSCDVYAFYGGYRFRTVAGPLPAHPATGAADAVPAPAPRAP